MKSSPVFRFAVAAVMVLWACAAPASGPFEYETRFFDQRNLENLLQGHLTDRFRPGTLSPLIAYLHLTNQFTPSHGELFRSQQRADHSNRSIAAWRHVSQFRSMLENEGYPSVYFDNWKTLTRTTFEDGRELVTRHSILNCAPDAFRVAGITLEDRKARYGGGSRKLMRWIEAQIKVFNHCGNEPFDPPAEPQDDWSKLERHDRQYQVAASYFYDGQYVEAARRFREIGATPDSPWSGLGRYLSGRSLTRAARVNAGKRDEYLRQVLDEYRPLVEDRGYVAEYPWILNELRHVEADLDPVPVLNELERKIINEPRIASVAEIRDYLHLASSHGSKRRGTSGPADWRRLSEALSRTGPKDAGDGGAEIMHRWLEERSLEWLFLALIAADSKVGEETLRELLAESGRYGPRTPGFYVMLEHRVRINGLLEDFPAALRLAEGPYRPPSPGPANRVRMRAANVSDNWKDYFRFASLRPLELPWSDAYIRSLPEERFNQVTTETTLFARESTRLINNYFTPRMMLEAIGYGGLSDYQRGRLAIAGWTKAMLMNDLDTARKFSGPIKRYLPRLKVRFEQFETGEDPEFEAALIVLDNPAFSPSMWPGVGRYEEWIESEWPAPDYVALPWNRYNWWCLRDMDYEQEERILSGPRFAAYDEPQLAQIRRIRELGRTSAAGFFGPYVLRYARSHPDDPRVPRALHRLVFATRYACMGGPGDVSRQAHNVLHKKFPGSEWTEKTPYWFD